jgi:hypothetical protein
MTTDWTLEGLILELNHRGWRLNNLYQLDNGQWQANARSGDKCFEFRRGSTAAEALARVLEAVPEKEVAEDLSEFEC